MKHLLQLRLLLLVSLLFGGIAANAKAPRPNILVILCDDLGYADVGFNGAKDIKTSELDQLASEGTILTSAYVGHAFCGPSRASLMTGRYPHIMGSQYNLPPHSVTINEGVPVEEVFMSKMLQQAGYYTGLVGKWHLGEAPQFHPNKRGFDEFYGFLGGGHNYYMDESQERYNRLIKAGKKRTSIFEYDMPLERNGVEEETTGYITDVLSTEGVNFVTNAAKKDNPFFLLMSYNAPHTPLQGKDEDLKLYAHIKDKSRRNYAAMVHAVDRGVGEIVNALKANGQFENTLIVFLSDNGGKTSKGANNFPLKMGKGSAHEGGYRIPMFFHWPKNVKAGQKFNHTVSALDLYPTFAGLAGAKIPKDRNLFGKNIWKKFNKGKAIHQKDLLYVMIHRKGYSDVGVRRGDWKALKTVNNKWQLFNITNDISEENDLSAKYPELLKELVTAAEKWGKTHTEPQWFHNEKTGVEWKRLKMPRFHETFAL